MDKKVTHDIAAGINREEEDSKPPGPSAAA
jgi:hypothetical protein